jgi:hypothetical protein
MMASSSVGRHGDIGACIVHRGLPEGGLGNTVDKIIIEQCVLLRAF